MCVCVCASTVGVVDEFGVALISYEFGGAPPPSHPPTSTFPSPPFTLHPFPSPSQVRKEFEVADADADGFLVEEELAQVGDAS